jgi:hypothetical protein
MNLSLDYADDARCDLTRELAALPTLSAAQLRERYAEVFGEPCRRPGLCYVVSEGSWGLPGGDAGQPVALVKQALVVGELKLGLP